MKTFAFILFLVISVRISYSEGGWTILNTGTTYNLHTIYFADTNTGFAAGDFGTFLKTTNGGLNWQTIHITQDSIVPAQDYYINSIYFFNAMKGFAIGYINQLSYLKAFLYQTTNSGLTWSGTILAGYMKDYYLYSVSFADQNRGIAVGYMVDYQTTEMLPLVVKTTNGGISLDIFYSELIYSV